MIKLNKKSYFHFANYYCKIAPNENAMLNKLTAGLFTKELADKGLYPLFAKAPNYFQEAYTIRIAAVPKGNN